MKDPRIMQQIILLLALFFAGLNRQNLQQMRRKQKEILEPGVEPWNQEQSVTLHLSEMRIESIFNPEFPIPQIQYKRDILLSPQLHQFSKSPTEFQKTNIVKPQSSKPNPGKKRSQIDFMKRNQESVKSYYLNTGNYRTILSDDNQHFTPLNWKQNTSYVVKRPTINTTYISYFQQKSSVVDSPIKSRARRNTFRRQSLDCKTRPRTSDSISFYQKQQQMLRPEDLQIMGRTTIAVGTSHLQKVLKIKQKLRQKLRKNSEKKDFKDGLYVKNLMKIEEEKSQQQIGKNRNNEEVLVIRKDKSTQKMQKKEKKELDKWKQYLNLKNQEQARRKMNTGDNKPSKLFLGVMGGSIYR